MTLWSGDTLAFVPGRPVDTVLTDRGDYRLDAGRIRLKPIALPRRDRQCAITVDVSLRSAGDPWDKSGTLFAFADAAGRDYLQRMQYGGDADTTHFAGTLSNLEGTREPALELLRFITPFGVGHFSHTERAQAYKPESVGAWADSVHWAADLSHMQSWLTDADTLWVGVYIDTWTAEGYTVSASITMDESDLPCDAALTQTTRPLLNTTKLAHDQRPFTAFPNGPLSVPFILDAPRPRRHPRLSDHRSRRPRGRRRIHRTGTHSPPRRRHPQSLDALAQRLRRLPPVQPDQRILALDLCRSRGHP